MGGDCANSAATVTKIATPPTHMTIAWIDLRSSAVLRQPRVEDRRDHERERTDRLHDEDRREREARELEQDREPEHHGADHPRGAGEQCQQRTHAEPGGLLAAQLLHALDALVLELGTEREEHGTDRVRSGCPLRRPGKSVI